MIAWSNDDDGHDSNYDILRMKHFVVFHIEIPMAGLPS